MAPNETTFFESNYPIVLTDKDTLSVDVTAPDGGGTGIGSMVNFIVNGDTSIEQGGLIVGIKSNRRVESYYDFFAQSGLDGVNPDTPISIPFYGTRGVYVGGRDNVCLLYTSPSPRDRG